MGWSERAWAALREAERRGLGYPARQRLWEALHPGSGEVFTFEEIDEFFLPPSPVEPQEELVVAATEALLEVLEALPPAPPPPSRQDPPNPQRMSNLFPPPRPRNPGSSGSGSGPAGGGVPRRPKPGGRSGGAALSPN